MTTRVLLVESHKESWDVLSRRLERRGYEVMVAVDGRQGVDRARTLRPDIVLLEMNLPAMDGWTAAGEIKKDPATARVPIIALTVHATSSDRGKAIAAGCDDYHAKPVDFPRLLGQIEALAGGPAASIRPEADEAGGNDCGSG